jgi:hypothetical protein
MTKVDAPSRNHLHFARDNRVFGVLIGATLILNALLLVNSPPIRSLDARFYYPAEFVASYLDSLGPDGRYLYLLNERTDLFFLVAYTALAYAVVVRIYTRYRTPLGWLPLVLCTLPGILDLIETATIIWLLLMDRGVPTFASHLLSVVTPLKWGSSFGVLFAFVHPWIKRKKPFNNDQF